MTKRDAFIGTAVAVLAMGLAVLALWKTGVFPTLSPAGPAVETAPEGPREPTPDGAGAAAETRRELPAAPSAEDAKKTPDGAETAAPAQGVESAPQATPGGEPAPQEASPGPARSAPEGEKSVPVPHVGSGQRRYPLQASSDGPESTGQKTGDARGGAKAGGGGSAGPLVLKFRFDPAGDGQMPVALVHYGDRVEIRARGASVPDCGLYLGFGFRGIYETERYKSLSVGPVRERGVPVRDGSRVYLTGAGGFGQDLPAKLNSKQGAVLKVGADCFYPQGAPTYEIEMRIYPGNRWHAMPKSLM